MEEKKDKVSIIGSMLCIAVIVAVIGSKFLSNSDEVQQAPTNPAQVQVQPVPQQMPVSPVELTDSFSVEATLPAAEEPVNLAPMHFGRDGEFQATFDPQSGGIADVTLNKFTVQTEVEEEKNDLVQMGIGSYPFMRLDNRSNGVVSYQAAVQTGNQIVRNSSIYDGVVSITETWTIDEANEYEIDYSLTVKNTGATPVHINRMALQSGALPAFLSRQKQTYLSGNAGFVAYGVPGKTKPKMLLEKNLRKLANKPEKRAELLNANADWVAVSSKYFLFALRKPRLSIADAAGNNRLIATCFSGVNGDMIIQDLRHPDVSLFAGTGWIPEYNLNPGETATFTSDAYCGPKNYMRLRDMGDGIDSVMGMNVFFFWSFAWMGWISQVLLSALIWLAGLFGTKCGYGLGIICITILVKLVFMPLSYRSTMSMRKMQAIQPQLKELRERFKDDPQRMYHEQQKLFKENNVSQLGGCLPMLAQIPVFFAMFNTFRSAIEIRNASFLWIADLSMPDDIFGLPIRPLALLTGVTMLFQQKLTPSPDPNQARMMTIMSLVFVVFFYNMPAALTLYMTVNQITSIIQMLIFRRLEKK